MQFTNIHRYTDKNRNRNTIIMTYEGSVLTRYTLCFSFGPACVYVCMFVYMYLRICADMMVFVRFQYCLITLKQNRRRLNSITIWRNINIISFSSQLYTITKGHWAGPNGQRPLNMPLVDVCMAYVSFTICLQYTLLMSPVKNCSLLKQYFLGFPLKLTGHITRWQPVDICMSFFLSVRVLVDTYIQPTPSRCSTFGRA